MKSRRPPGSTSWWERQLERYPLVRRGADWLQEKLWVRPVLYSIGAVIVAVTSGFADLLPFPDGVPDIATELISTLMSVLTASMLGVATFAVASMVSAYASVGSNATPRAFSLIVADDMSKRALSTFIGAFIFGTIGLIALNLKFYDVQGRLALFTITLLIYAWVIWTFVSWVDAVARLGRMETAIQRLERACGRALREAGRSPFRGAMAPEDTSDFGHIVGPDEVGHVLDIDMARLQEEAERHQAVLLVVARPGDFVDPCRPIARVDREVDAEAVASAFFIGPQRTFSGDARFGLVALSQVASRALSPGVNDPGTAIDVIGTSVRLLLDWSRVRRECARAESQPEVAYPNVRFPRLTAETLLDDAYTSIARYGAQHLDVSLRLQRALESLARSGDPELTEAAVELSKSALERCRLHIDYDEDLRRVEKAAAAVEEAASESATPSRSVS